MQQATLLGKSLACQVRVPGPTGQPRSFPFAENELSELAKVPDWRKMQRASLRHVVAEDPPQ
jgi:hypothetical protein